MPSDPKPKKFWTSASSTPYSGILENAKLGGSRFTSVFKWYKILHHYKFFKNSSTLNVCKSTNGKKVGLEIFLKTHYI